ncbi:MAG: hypothetical protein JWO03_487 [Bacteroidetes bacterium]|nr:hypothetical protein [Bacteroidota bacterium]
MTANFFELSLVECKLKTIIDLDTNQKIKSFFYPLTGSKYKIYIVTSKDKVLYIGTTKDSVKSRLRSGLNASGQNGYHGYKWKKYKKVRLAVWCFEDLNQDQVENVEAELAFLVRSQTGLWPDCQNEIHFNNLFCPKGEILAIKIYKQLLQMNSKPESTVESWKNLDSSLKASINRGIKQADKGLFTPNEEIWPVLKMKYSEKGKLL